LICKIQMLFGGLVSGLPSGRAETSG